MIRGKIPSRNHGRKQWLAFIIIFYSTPGYKITPLEVV